MTAEEARSHIRYSTWASQRLLEAVEALDPEMAGRDVGASHKSILGTLAHVEMADRIWLRRVTALPFPPTGEVERDLPEIRGHWERFADGLQDSELARVIAYRDLKGNPYETRLDHIILHVVNHATLHRGQVMGMMRQMGIAPPATDLIFYIREQQQRAGA